MCEGGGDERIVDYRTEVEIGEDRIIVRMASSMRRGRLLLFLASLFFAGCCIAGVIQQREYWAALLLGVIAAIVLISFGASVVRLYRSHRNHPLVVIMDNHCRPDEDSTSTISAASISRLVIRGRRSRDPSYRLYAICQAREYPVFLYQADRAVRVRDLAARLAERWGKQVVED